MSLSMGWTQAQAQALAEPDQKNQHANRCAKGACVAGRGLRWGMGAVLVWVLMACSQPEPPAPPLRAVKLWTVGASAAQTQVAFSGEVRAQVESRLGFRVAGKLVLRPVELGQRVQAGQLLAQLDERDYTLAEQAVRAQVSAAQTQYELARSDVQRFRQLQAENFISAAELERRQAQLQASQAGLQQAQAQLAAQGNQSRYTRLVADAAGVVTSVDAEPGQVVAAGTPVLRLALDGPRDAVFVVPEDQVQAWQVGQPVRVRAWSGSATRAEDWLQAQVREVAASADPLTRTFVIKAGLLAGNAALPLGATVVVQPLPGAVQQAGAGAQAAGLGAAPAILRLPSAAVFEQAGQSAVWLFEPESAGAQQGTVRTQVVQLAGVDGNDVVLAAGLAPGQQVVATGVHVLAPGQRVQVYRPKSGSVDASEKNQSNWPQTLTDKGQEAIHKEATQALSDGQKGAP